MSLVLGGFRMLKITRMKEWNWVWKNEHGWVMFSSDRVTTCESGYCFIIFDHSVGGYYNVITRPDGTMLKCPAVHGDAEKDLQRTIDKWLISIGPESVSGVKHIRMSGTSMTVAVTDLAKAIDLGPGDYVEVTLRRLKNL